MRSIKEQIPLMEYKWYAVKCKYKCENRVMEDLKRQGIEVYVPFLVKSNQFASSTKSVKPKVLIPSHVFVKIVQSQYIPILKHPYVFQFLNFSNALSSIREEEMEVMKRIVGEVDDIVIDRTSYEKGDRVEIIGGELTGLSGYVLERRHHNVKIVLNSIGIDLFITVDPIWLIKIGSCKVEETYEEMR